ncbi:MAG: ribonuclease HII [Proteobacteria bacterium]|nr:ribonuclease HII [Pseudomonadota bacterium]
MARNSDKNRQATLTLSECIESTHLASFDGVILGCDEVGRGPLAGPVTGACVAFAPQLKADFPLFSCLNDSKKLSPSAREALVEPIKEAALAYAVVDVDHIVIDEINILQASLQAMRLAAEAVARTLGRTDLHVLVDGNRPIPGLLWAQSHHIKGDARSWSIAAASILAKVHRDALMAAYDTQYPGYGFARHAGYPTAMHRQAIAALGLSPIHRRSYRCQ